MTHFDTVMLSSPGGREDNEDYCDYRMRDRLAQGEAEGGCWVLADGLGGHAGGALAARTAVDAALASYETNPEVSSQAAASHVAAANQAVLRKQQNEPSLETMRTTVAMLLASSELALWAHCGDTRLYHFRAGKVAAQTRDHSVPQRLVDAGELAPDQIRFHEDRNRLLRSLGAKADPGAAVLDAPVEIQPGDAFLLASDGFWEFVTEPEMERDLVESKNATDWIEAMKARLLARATPGHDNYTAVAVICSPGAAPQKDARPTGMLGRWFRGRQ